MKTQTCTHTTRANRSGSILVITVVTLFVLTIMAVSYLFMLQNGNRFVARDQAWNRALVVAEAGIEEGMAYVNRGGLALTPQAYSNAWVTMPRTSLYGGSYNVVLSGSPGVVTITSTGMVTAPLSSTQIKRVVQVTAPFTSSFQIGIAALTGVNMNGNKINVDSYNSRDLTNFPGGLYNYAHRRDHGDVATLENSATWFQLGNANIAGTLHTAPAADYNTDYQAAIAAVGANGSVGDTNWTVNNHSIESTAFFKDDFNMMIADVPPPYGVINNLPSTANSGTNALSSGMYSYSGNYTIPTGGTLEVLAGQYVEIYVTGNFTMKGSGQTAGTINIDPGGTLVLYVGGSSTTVANLNNNGPGNNAGNFQYFGLPGNTSIGLAGNATYMGTIYAPEATITLNGGGNSTTNDFQGGMIVNALNLKGHFNMHFDENLQTNQTDGTFIATNWVELTAK